MGRPKKDPSAKRFPISVMLTGDEIAALEHRGGTVNKAVQAYAQLLAEGSPAAQVGPKSPPPADPLPILDNPTPPEPVEDGPCSRASVRQIASAHGKPGGAVDMSKVF